jgi:hypothetical protein
MMLAHISRMRNKVSEFKRPNGYDGKYSSLQVTSDSTLIVVPSECRPRVSFDTSHSFRIFGS